MSKPPKDPLAAVDKFLDQLKEQRRWKKGVEIGHVPVDSGCVEFSFTGELGNMTPLQEKVEDLAMGTHQGGYENGRGFIRIGCDGKVRIVVCTPIVSPDFGDEPGEYMGRCRPPKGATEIILGDCGKIFVRQKLRDPEKSVAFWLQRGPEAGTLWVAI